MDHHHCLYSYMHGEPKRSIQVVQVRTSIYLLYFNNEEVHYNRQEIRGSGLECGVVDNRGRGKNHTQKHEFTLDLLFSNGPPPANLRVPEIVRRAIQNATGLREFCVHVSWEISLQRYLLANKHRVWRTFQGYLELNADILTMLRNLIRGLIYLLKKGFDISTLTTDMIVFCENDERRTKPQIITCMLGRSEDTSTSGTKCAQSWCSSSSNSKSSMSSSSSSGYSHSYCSSSGRAQSSSSRSRGAPLSVLADIIEAEIMPLANGRVVHPMVTSLLNCLRGGVRGHRGARMSGTSPITFNYRMEEEILRHPVFLNSEERTYYLVTVFQQMRIPYHRVQHEWLEVREICMTESFVNPAVHSRHAPHHDWRLVLQNGTTSHLLSERFIDYGSSYRVNSVAECVRFNRNSVTHINDDYSTPEEGEPNPDPIDEWYFGVNMMRCWPNLLSYLFEFYGTCAREQSRLE